MKHDLPKLLAQATRCHETGQWHEAERLYRAILNVDPRHADALHQFGLLAHQNGQNDVAVDLVTRALGVAPRQALFYNTLGGAHLAAGRAADAVAAFEKGLTLAPTSIELRNNLANALQAQGRLDDAIAAYRMVLEAAPGDADVLNNLGHALQIRGDVDEALRHFRQACDRRPDDPWILSHLGNALSTKGDYAAAVEICERAVALDAKSAIAQTNLGNALFGLKRYAEAADAYRLAIALQPRVPEIHKNLGIACHILGRWDEAKACFAKTLELRPDDDVHAALGESYAALGNREEAVAAFQRALETKPGDANILFALGTILNDLGRQAEGLEAIARGPGVVRFSAEGDAGDAQVRRLPLVSASAPHFIGCWTLHDPELCDRLIAFFDAHAGQHTAGASYVGLNVDIKKTTELAIFPNNIGAPVAAYLRELEFLYRDYARQWPAFAEVLPRADIEPFKIQRYGVGGHYQKTHSERVSLGLMHRVLAWMTYLDDVEEGGETCFPHYDLAVKPQRGKTLIWPAEWTHAHAGGVVKAGTKYIVTGWMHFPHTREF